MDEFMFAGESKIGHLCSIVHAFLSSSNSASGYLLCNHLAIEKK